MLLWVSLLHLALHNSEAQHLDPDQRNNEDQHRYPEQHNNDNQHLDP